jgi:hypothetical protein
MHGGIYYSGPRAFTVPCAGGLAKLRLGDATKFPKKALAKFSIPGDEFGVI